MVQIGALLGTPLWGSLAGGWREFLCKFLCKAFTPPPRRTRGSLRGTGSSSIGPSPTWYLGLNHAQGRCPHTPQVLKAQKVTAAPRVCHSAEKVAISPPIVRPPLPPVSPSEMVPSPPWERCGLMPRRLPRGQEEVPPFWICLFRNQPAAQLRDWGIPGPAEPAVPFRRTCSGGSPGPGSLRKPGSSRNWSGIDQISWHTSRADFAQENGVGISKTS
jgi:hypothetical protein